MNVESQISESLDPTLAESPRQSGMKRRVLLATGVVLFTLLLAEVALQIFYRVTVGQWLITRTGLPLFVADERFVYWNKPHMAFQHRTSEFQSDITTNGQGFRVRSGEGDYSLSKPLDAKRVLLLGPSFAFGWGVNYEQSFACRLQDLLNEQLPKNSQSVELINAGVPSMGPALNLDWFKAVGKDFHPDLVIQMIYTTMAVPRVGNRHDIDVDAEGYLVRRNLSWRYYMTLYAKKSALVFYTWMAYVRAKGAAAAPGEGGAILGAGRDANLHDTFDVHEPETAEAIEYYDDLRKTVEASGAKLLVVYVPLSFCVHREDAARWSHLGVRNVDAQIAYDEAFCEYLRGQGFDCVNTTSDLQAAAAAGKRLYYLIDIHWTPAGNEVAARSVYEHLRREGE
jgi:hypothetical protein